MFYSILSIVLLSVISLSTSSSSSNSERNVLARFYSNFAQIYRPVISKSGQTEFDDEQSVQRYQFIFPEKEYSQISEESLTILHANVLQRSIVYHPMPNFETVGSRYFYRRDPKDPEPIEIELVNSRDRLFREVRRSNRYFYLQSFDGLEYVKNVPVMPYYEVTFMCNSSDGHTQSPLLSYIDKNLQWTPRYLLDLPQFSSGKKPELLAYADIYNRGEQMVTIKGAELISGDIKINSKPFENFKASLQYGAAPTSFMQSQISEKSRAYSLGEQASGTYVFQLTLPSSMTVAPQSTKSVPFIETNITVTSFVYYSSVFSTVNSHGKLSNAYNITSVNAFLPSGRLLLREQGRFIGDTDLPDLALGETYTMVLGLDADVLYQRYVKILEGDEDSQTITYNVKYVFENFKQTRNVQLYFVESFGSLKYYQIKDISKSNNNKQFYDLTSYGTDLRGFMTIPRESGQRIISYNVIVYKDNPKTPSYQKSFQRNRFSSI